MADITAEARRQLAVDGPAGLSLRAVARELGMVSSGIYRYVDSRDALLTRLLVECYDELGAVAEAALADARSNDGDRLAQWRAVCAAIRQWAFEHPHDYALLYGSPVPGYAAPEDTIVPAQRVYAALAAPIGGKRSRRKPVEISASWSDDAKRMADVLDVDLDEASAAGLLRAVAGLFGVLSLELFGHTHNVITDTDAFFAHHVDRLADDLGL